VDFALVPPEINSALMYAGPGSGSMLAAAAAWDGLATDLYSTASLYESIIAGLTAGPWIGPASAAMAAAATPQVAWLQVTAAQAEQTADQAKVAAMAYETAFAETVPPPVVAANRTLLMALVASNLFGQNTPAIAVTEAQYADMWAQDTGAMQGYAGAAATATTLPPFSEPPASADSTGLSNQAAAVSQATNTAAGDVQSTVTTVQQTFSAIPNTLSGLANPAAVGDALTPLQVLDLLGDLSSIFVDPEIGTAGVTLDGILAGAALPYDINGYFVGLHTDDIVSGWAGLEAWPGTASAPPTSFPVINPVGSMASAALGEANTVGALSVPSGWTTAAPALRLAAMSLPATSVGAAAEASSAGSMFSQMALAGMAGRAMAGTVGTGGGAGGVRARERGGVTKRETETNEMTEETATPLQVPAGGPITSIAAELRELASLRDAGILTQDEFTEQKQRLLPH
jgi:PPE-repeat protein